MTSNSCPQKLVGVAGTIGIGFEAAGIILAGYIITKFKPSARKMALWNVFIGMISAACIVSYTLVGCHDNNMFGELTSEGE